MLEYMQLENVVFIDIETVPGMRSYDDLNPYEQKLWEDKKGKTRDVDVDAADFYFQNAGILAEFGKIVCISLGYFSKKQGDRVFKVKSIIHDDEKELLHEFVDILNRFNNSFNGRLALCGHNIREFDIPYICRRLLINGLANHFPTYLLKFQAAKPWELQEMMIDTLALWKFGDYKNYISLKLMTHVLGVPSPKDDIDGSEVGRVYYHENDLKRIAVYCEKDVIAVAQVVMKMKGLSLIEAEEVIYG
ncbi:MAG: ribonuclease H-like domain-containing protein [Chitinophagales bacterium]|nr:ribonuclease H-like domain-containing protein [Chitinophagales bacterium]